MSQPAEENPKGQALGRIEPQGLARAVAAVPGPAVGQNHGVHGAGARSGDRLEIEPSVLQQRVEHAPGEGAMRSPALQGEIDGFIASGHGGRLS